MITDRKQGLNLASRLPVKPLEDYVVPPESIQYLSPEPAPATVNYHSKGEVKVANLGDVRVGLSNQLVVTGTAETVELIKRPRVGYRLVDGVPHFRLMSGDANTGYTWSEVKGSLVPTWKFSVPPHLAGVKKTHKRFKSSRPDKITLTDTGELELIMPATMPPPKVMSQGSRRKINQPPRPEDAKKREYTEESHENRVGVGGRRTTQPQTVAEAVAALEEIAGTESVEAAESVEALREQFPTLMGTYKVGLHEVRQARDLLNKFTLDNPEFCLTLNDGFVSVALK